MHGMKPQWSDNSIRWDAYPSSKFSESWSLPDPKDEGVVRALRSGLIEQFSSRGWRTHARVAGGTGTSDRVRVREGIEVNVLNCTLPERDERVYDADEPVVFLYASLTGDVCFRQQGADPIVMNRPELTLLSVPQGMKVSIDIRNNVRHQRMFGIFRHGAIAALLGVPARELPQALRVASTGEASFGRLVSVPLDHKVASLVADTIDTPLSGEMRALQYEGRLFELLAFALQALGRDETAPLSAQTQGLRNQRDAELAQRALDRLSKEYGQSPDLRALAREFGTNASKLRATFKAAYGVTMSEYCLDRRMREAQKLLLEARLSIAQIAERVGYEYHGGFTAAFTRHVGITPKQYREQRAPINIPLRGTGDGGVLP